ncbi:MAG: hypothetical protein EHM45_12685 [Desulfobacteraceae bacterium]|nr:MAG: hypothetical protein EHM45_12685 [Desulfobacteraceae bacterium]
MEVNKADWKKFRNSLEMWRERYLKRKNNEIRAILGSKDLDETGKFWNIAEFQKTEIKKLRNCLDNYTRSNMTLHMALMKEYGMIDPEDIREFSVEMQKHIERIPFS